MSPKTIAKTAAPTQQSSDIDIGQAIGYGWASIKNDLWYFVGIALVVIVIGGIGRNHDTPNSWNILGLFASAWMACGYWTMFLSYQAGKKLPFSALFTHLEPFWRLLGASLLLGIIIGLGLVVLIIPGIYFALKYQFTVPLIVDKKMGVFDAMRESDRLTSGKKMSLLGFDLVSVGVMLLGVLALGVGVLVTFPLVILANVQVYRNLQ